MFHEYTEELREVITKINALDVNKCFIIRDLYKEIDRAFQNRLKGYLSFLILLNYIEVISNISNGVYVYKLNKKIEL